MAFLIFVVATVVLLYRVTTSETRIHYLKIALAGVHQLRASATRPRPELEALEATLGARGGRPLLTPALIAVCVAALVLGWEPSTGIRTTNGQWWRLLTAPFVHPTLLQIAINCG